MKVLIIDTSENDKTTLLLVEDSKVAHHVFDGTQRDLLRYIADFLSEKACPAESLTGIGVVVGAGRFSSTRIAATVGNTWHYVHKIPVFGMNTEDVQKILRGELVFTMPETSGFLSPEYSAPPHIGKKKE